MDDLTKPKTSLQGNERTSTFYDLFRRRSFLLARRLCKELRRAGAVAQALPPMLAFPLYP
jgi:hypothetical protein